MKAIICLEKFSDWLEAYSVFIDNTDLKEVRLIYIENERNNKKAVESLFEEYKNNISFEYQGFTDRTLYFKACRDSLSELSKGDVLAAPFIRYREIWTLVPEARVKGITTVHLSESFPDSFGRLGYRLGFRLVGGFDIKGFIKQLCIMPFAYHYANTHKPDICYYNMYPAVKNEFVRTTKQAHLPKVNTKKKAFLLDKINGEKRTLLIAGFGYNLQNMVKYLNLNKYIATSKDREIIIDGIRYPLDDYICAEEVLLSGCVDSIIGYNSTAMCWAYLIGNIKITCYETKRLSYQYGFLNGYLTRKTLKKCGIELLPECKEMLD